ncbi:uncharacterized protein LOC119365886 [Triticum dicoccoides]|uniref:uncharacterized protein LOC119365886 n=1 Tax=Triticum dicoccoides TaxID=85692 RepID=UPI00188DEBC3|nr:uncharacterized protein LOC119365886 [Triticum dicoccoides]
MGEAWLIERGQLEELAIQQPGTTAPQAFTEGRGYCLCNDIGLPKETHVRQLEEEVTTAHSHRDDNSLGDYAPVTLAWQTQHQLVCAVQWFDRWRLSGKPSKFKLKGAGQ